MNQVTPPLPPAAPIPHWARTADPARRARVAADFGGFLFSDDDLARAQQHAAREELDAQRAAGGRAQASPTNGPSRQSWKEGDSLLFDRTLERAIRNNEPITDPGIWSEATWLILSTCARCGADVSARSILDNLEIRARTQISEAALGNAMAVGQSDTLQAALDGGWYFPLLLRWCSGRAGPEQTKDGLGRSVRRLGWLVAAGKILLTGTMAADLLRIMSEMDTSALVAGPERFSVDHLLWRSLLAAPEGSAALAAAAIDHVDPHHAAGVLIDDTNAAHWVILQHRLVTWDIPITQIDNDASMAQILDLKPYAPGVAGPDEDRVPMNTWADSCIAGGAWLDRCAAAGDRRWDLWDTAARPTLIATLQQPHRARSGMAQAHWWAQRTLAEEILDWTTAHNDIAGWMRPGGVFPDDGDNLGHVVMRALQRIFPQQKLDEDPRYLDGIVLRLAGWMMQANPLGLYPSDMAAQGAARAAVERAMMDQRISAPEGTTESAAERCGPGGRRKI